MSQKAMDRTMRYLYDKQMGCLTQKVVTNPFMSAVAGAFMDTKLSTQAIEGFVRRNNIDLSEYEESEYTCFNDFFTRRVKPSERPVDRDPEVLISPCDGMMTAFRISEDSEFAIKDSYYNVDDLVGGDEIAHKYINGICLVLRLGVDNYHRYCYIDDGWKTGNHHIPGKYHPVQPIVVRKHPVFMQTTREYCTMFTEHFGEVVQIEVGACLVGKIKNHRGPGRMRRGEEKGMFLFGGSTIVLLFKEGVLRLPENLLADSLCGIEQPVKYGAAIARRAH